MSLGRDVVIVSGARTAIGGYGGSLKGMAPTETGEIVVREAISRAGLQGADVGSCVIGNVIHTQRQDMYISRVVGINAGLPTESHSLTVNRLCGSGLQAIISAAQQVMLGDVDAAVAGGAESMSRAFYGVSATRFGARMGNTEMEDLMVGALTDPFSTNHMGITAENIAEQWGIPREDQDAFAAESQRRALNAIEQGHFKDQIVPVELKSRKGTKIFDTDEHPTEGTTAESLAGLRPAFKRDGGSVTAGNASGLNDGAAAVVLMEAEAAAKKGVAPMAKLLGYGLAGVDPNIMGIGPVPAVKRALDQAGVSVDQLDVIESNEAFAVQACAVSKDLGFPAEKTNPNGGAIALGHPIGATGAILMVKCLYELKRTGGKYGLVTMCIGGGQGIAAVVENVA